jgi:hypothetical protein
MFSKVLSVTSIRWIRDYTFLEYELTECTEQAPESATLEIHSERVRRLTLIQYTFEVIKTILLQAYFHLEHFIFRGGAKSLPLLRRPVVFHDSV